MLLAWLGSQTAGTTDHLGTLAKYALQTVNTFSTAYLSIANDELFTLTSYEAFSQVFVPAAKVHDTKKHQARFDFFRYLALTARKNSNFKALEL